MILAGRGFGKTRTGIEWIRDGVTKGECGRVALIAEDAGDARDVLVEGESGILAVSNPRFRPRYVGSKRRLTWPNGAVATIFSDKDFEALRGPQHDRILFDELAKFPNQKATFDNAMFGLRLGKNPRWCATTTPRPTPLIKALIKDPAVMVTHGTTYENLENLAESYKLIIRGYEGTRLGRQELKAELLEDTPGALWTLGIIETNRVYDIGKNDMDRVVVAIDPSASKGENSAEAGIVAAGTRVVDGARHGYVLRDDSGTMKPIEWARKAIALYRELDADCIVAEANNGGEMVRTVLEAVDPAIPVRLVWASRGKITRAEPMATLYERNLIHHVGVFSKLEDQMCTYVPGEESPDRMDALVWALSSLFSVVPVDMSAATIVMNRLVSTEKPW